MEMSRLQTMSVTLLALTVIGVTAAGWLLGHCTFDQFVSIAGPAGGGATFLHFIAPQAHAVPAVSPLADPIEPPGDTTEAVTA